MSFIINPSTRVDFLKNKNKIKCNLFSPDITKSIETAIDSLVVDYKTFLYI